MRFVICWELFEVLLIMICFNWFSSLHYTMSIKYKLFEILTNLTIKSLLCPCFLGTEIVIENLEKVLIIMLIGNH